MAKILLDYFFKITAINPTPAASTAFLRQVLVVGLPFDGGVTTGEITLCTTPSAVAAILSANAKAEADKLFDGGLSRVYVLPTDDLDISAALDENENTFFTVLISSDFGDDDIGAADGETVAEVKSFKKIQDILYTSKLVGVLGNDITVTYVDDGTAGAETVGVSTHAITVHMEDGASTAAEIATAIANYSPSNALVGVAVDSGDEGDVQAAVTAQTLTGGVDAVLGDGLDVGGFLGVVGVSSDDTDFLADQAAIENRCAFFEAGSTNAKNMFYAFGKLLSNTLDWKNQQYITMPLADDVAVLGDAEALFDDKISFVISDDEFGKRLALFCAGGKAIVAPYIIRNLEIDLQSKGLQYVSANQPAYTLTQAALLEDELQKVIDGDGLENGNPGYVGKGWITEGTVRVTLEEDNFVAAGRIAVPTPRALWRIAGQLTQS